MATMGAVLADLREEVVKKIYAVDPEVYPGDQWNVHEPTDGSPFEEQASRRRFKVGWFSPARFGLGRTWDGRTGYRKYELTGAIKIHYGKTDDDMLAAAADADKIARTLIDTSPTSTGVDYYCVPSFGEFSTEETGEGDGLLVTIPLFAVIETTE